MSRTKRKDSLTGGKVNDGRQRRTFLGGVTAENGVYRMCHMDSDSDWALSPKGNRRYKRTARRTIRRDGKETIREEER